MFLHEALDAVPESRDGLDVFVQAEHETVLFLVVGHEFERIVVDVAEELNARLHTPVPLVLHHDGVAEEEARLVTTHMPVAHRIAINDLLLVHLLADLCSLVDINPFWERPVFFGNLAISRLSGDQ